MLETQLKEARYIAEDADHKYDEVTSTAWVGCLRALSVSVHVYSGRPLLFSGSLLVTLIHRSNHAPDTRSTLGPLPASCHRPIGRTVRFRACVRHMRRAIRMMSLSLFLRCINVYVVVRSFRGRKVLENRNINDDERIQQLEKELEETILLGEEADRKYDEVTVLHA